MAFIDEITIHAEAGAGGDGVVRWRREKFLPKGGPAGGDGGRGGNFYIQAIKDIHVLHRYKSKTEFNAERGENGGKRSLHGKKGEDYILELPVGSVVTNLETDEIYSLDEEGQKIMLLKGGAGGYGNEHFKSPSNVAPKEFTHGKPGEVGDFRIELELFADIGLVGMPNAGKSSLLNSITNSKAKTAEYPFTTLDPNLGNFYGFIIADIPGLIEGASSGKGLGIKFLRHIKRTRMLAHLVSFENEDMWQVYQDIRHELDTYDKENQLPDGLGKKDEIIILSKTDVVPSEEVERKKEEFEQKLKESGLERRLFTLSLYDDESIKMFSDSLSKILENK